MGRRSTEALWLLVSIPLLYTLHRAVVLRVEYLDGHQYLANARALLGEAAPYDGLRPPFVPLVQLPAVALGLRTPAGTPRLLAAHLTAAFVSGLAAAAVFWCLLAVFPPPYAVLGMLLFVASRCFVRYGAHVMADLPAAGWAAATVGLYLRAGDMGSLRVYLACGAALGFGTLTKFPLVTLGPALAAAELWAALQGRRLALHRWGGLVLAGATAAALFLGVEAATLAMRVPYVVALQLRAQVARLWSISPSIGRYTDESWWDWGELWRLTLSSPTLACAALGLGLALVRRERRDLPFLTWLAVVGGSAVFVTGHNEARYLLPALPAILYFAVRAVEWAVRTAGRLGAGARRGWALAGLALLAVALAGAVDQARLDRDSLFFSDVACRTAQRLGELRRHGGRAFWLGDWHTFVPRRSLGLKQDEFFDTFHFAPFIAEHCLGERVMTLPASGATPQHVALSPLLRDGDVVLRTADEMYTARTLPPGGVPPPEVWAVRQLVLERLAPDRFVDPRRPAVAVDVGETGGTTTIRSEHIRGPWRVIAASAGRQRRPLGEVTLGPGAAAVLTGPVGDDVATLLLVRIDREAVTPGGDRP